ncbi:hypothetical protein [Mesorhizobium sp. M0578]|uniref:hypothetical protein n=1 Tax=unclassified Mesorhizobium TaxID=325217 RepID=UPI00333831AA
METWLSDRIGNHLASPPDMDIDAGYLATLIDAYYHAWEKQNRGFRLPWRL